MKANQRRFAVDEKEYPFKDHWFTRNGSTMHYVDEGSGPAVLMLHGNPTWSFLYRKVIKGLTGKCRAIAPDYPGFGLSDHPAGYGYTPAEHADWVAALLDHLEIDRHILIVQDWGGPIGLSLAVRNPERLAGLVLCNTWCWAPMTNALVFSFVMGGPLGPFLQMKKNVFARFLVPAGIVAKENKTSGILAAYLAPFPDPASRKGTYVFPREIRKSAEWLGEIEGKLPLIAQKPIEMVWAMKDFAFGSESYVKRWLGHFPGANLNRIENASHYLQEDCPEQIAVAVERLLAKIG
ncbi:MAG: alpha/beta fold hydrolase [Thermodesulfobacteriota bacterium]